MFNVGDKVKVIKFSGLDGITGTIIKIINEGLETMDDDEIFISVNLDKNDVRNVNPFPFLSDEIELVLPLEPDWEV